MIMKGHPLRPYLFTRQHHTNCLNYSIIGHITIDIYANSTKYCRRMPNVDKGGRKATSCHVPSYVLLQPSAEMNKEAHPYQSSQYDLPNFLLPLVKKELLEDKPQIKPRLAPNMPYFNNTLLPKGASDRRAILKCCLPKGMPMIVINSNTPKMMCMSHAHKPPIMIHNTLSGIRMQPSSESVSSISAPKGHKHNRPILKVWNATGKPMIVQAIARLPVKYPMAASSPPKTNHNTFPIILIVFLLKSFTITLSSDPKE